MISSISNGIGPVGNRLSANSTLPGINPIAGTYNANDEVSSAGGPVIRNTMSLRSCGPFIAVLSR
jgi:hypothetical protein